MDLPHRKQNRLPQFDYSASGAYFITICTQDRKPLLCEIVGDGSPVPKCAGKIAEQFIQKISEKYPNVTVDKYVIMPDHIHLLIQIHTVVGEAFRLPLIQDHTVGEAFRLPLIQDHTVGEASRLPQIRPEKNGTGNPSPTVENVIGWLKYQITKQVNTLLGTVGDRLFQRSYYDHVIRNQRDYDEVWEYIEANPSKWLDGKMDDI